MLSYYKQNRSFFISFDCMRLFVMLLLVLFHSITTIVAQEGRLVVSKDPNDSTKLICDVQFATFTVPKDWRPNRSGNNTYAILSRANEKEQNHTQLISIDIGKPVVKTSKELADLCAKTWQGQVSNDTVNLDSEVGYRITAPADKTNVKPVNCILTIKDDRVFMLIGGSKEEGQVDQALTELVASWKWKKQ